MIREADPCIAGTGPLFCALMGALRKMHKACAGGAVLHGANKVVTGFLGQTGFDAILRITRGQ